MSAVLLGERLVARGYTRLDEVCSDQASGNTCH